MTVDRMVTLETVLDVIPVVSLAIVLAYYALQIRNQNRTRQADLYLRLWGRWNTMEFSEQRYEAYRMEWTDRDDFNEKYNPINNPEAFASWNTFGRMISGVAELRRKNLIDIDFLDEEMINDIRWFWVGFGSLEKEGWERGTPAWGNHFPFMKEVIDYDRRKRPWLYDEVTGEFKLPQRFRDQGAVWIQPEEIEQIRMKLYK